MSRLPSPPEPELTPGCRVAFRLGSPPYLEGVRTGVVVRLDEPARAFLRRHAREGARLEDLLRLAGGLVLPVVRIDPIPGLVPLGLELICRPENLEVIDASDHRQAN